MKGLEYETQVLGPEIGQFFPRQFVQLDPGHFNLAGGGMVHAPQYGEQGAFARSRLPHDGNEFTAFDSDVDTAQCLDGIFSAGVMLGQVVYFDKCHNY